MVTLIIGGAGYIGSHIVVACHAAGLNPVILDDFSYSSPRAVDAIRKLTSSSLIVEEGDASDRSFLNIVFNQHEVGAVIHLAAFKSAPESIIKPLMYYRNNLNALISVAEMSVEHHVKRLVFSSSAAVYGTPAHSPITEKSPLTPINPYGRTKLMGEQILQDIASTSKLEVVNLRYFNPVGAHWSGLIGEDPSGTPGNLVPRIMRTAAKQSGPVPVFGNDYDTPDGTAVRDYIHVVDLAEGHLAALTAASDDLSPYDNSHLGHNSTFTYNLGTGKGSSVLEVLNAAATATGNPIAHVIQDRRLGDPPSIWADCQRAYAELKWSARHGLSSMLRDHWNWHQNNLEGY